MSRAAVKVCVAIVFLAWVGTASGGPRPDRTVTWQDFDPGVDKTNGITVAKRTLGVRDLMGTTVAFRAKDGECVRIMDSLATTCFVRPKAACTADRWCPYEISLVADDVCAELVGSAAFDLVLDVLATCDASKPNGKYALEFLDAYETSTPTCRLERGPLQRDELRYTNGPLDDVEGGIFVDPYWYYLEPASDGFFSVRGETAVALRKHVGMNKGPLPFSAWLPGTAGERAYLLVADMPGGRAPKSDAEKCKVENDPPLTEWCRLEAAKALRFWAKYRRWSLGHTVLGYTDDEAAMEAAQRRAKNEMPDRGTRPLLWHREMGAAGSLPFVLCVDLRCGQDFLWQVRDFEYGYDLEDLVPAVTAGQSPSAGAPILHSRAAYPWLERFRFVDLRVRNVPPMTSIEVEGEISGGFLDEVLDDPYYVPGDLTLSVTPSGTKQPSEDDPHVLLAPRTPGAMTIVFNRQREVPETSTSTRSVREDVRKDSVDLIVLKSFAGAIRFGVSFGFTPTQEAWGVEQLDDSAGVVVYGGTRWFEPEFVVGFAPFLERGGRTYYPRRRQVRAAPYFGVGIVGAAEDAGATVPVGFLRSLYAGVEVEFGRYFSVAIAAMAKRGSMLESGLEQGDLVDWSGDDPPDVTRSEPYGGVALVLNLSPVYFEVVKGQLGDYPGKEGASE